MQVVSHSGSPCPLQETGGLSGVALGPGASTPPGESEWRTSHASPRPPASQTLGRAQQSASGDSNVPKV